MRVEQSRVSRLFYRVEVETRDRDMTIWFRHTLLGRVALWAAERLFKLTLPDGREPRRYPRR